MERLMLPPSGRVPNHPRLPVLLLRGGLPAETPAQIEAALAKRGWTNGWRDGIYPFHHYHSTAHEVLVVAQGHAEVVLGGEGGTRLHLQRGDVVVLPAGTGHCKVGGSADFLVVGAYAGGRSWDICKPEETDPEWARARIAAVPDWEQEPV